MVFFLKKKSKVTENTRKYAHVIPNEEPSIKKTDFVTTYKIIFNFVFVHEL